MLDIKKCRKIKKEYTKNNEGKNIIFNVENFPLCYMIITHGDGKSWGYFFNKDAHCFLGRNNQEVVESNLQIKQYNAFSEGYCIKLIGGNNAVKDVYTRFLKYLDRTYSYCKNWHIRQDLSRMFHINPMLFANLVDCDVLRGCSKYSNTEFDYLHKLQDFSKRFNYTKPLIKDACKLPPKWVKFVIRYSATSDYVELLRKYNYPVDDLLNITTWYGAIIPTELIPNKEAGWKYVSDNYYRDYYNMRALLSDESRKQFPINPKDIKKYHDLAVQIYYREAAYRKEKELAEKQKRYTDNVYDKATAYNYSDDTYSIKACEKLTDLLIEGSTLRHCVGSYVDSVSLGKEYILFLRKNSDPDTPYFTIDVTPDLRVRQIHGLCNCNITKDIKPFIEDWAKKFNLHLGNCSGVYCALR